MWTARAARSTEILNQGKLINGVDALVSFAWTIVVSLRQLRFNVNRTSVGLYESVTCKPRLANVITILLEFLKFSDRSQWISYHKKNRRSSGGIDNLGYASYHWQYQCSNLP